ADRIWRAAFVFESRSRPSTTADEHPYKTLPVDHDRWIVMGIYDSLLVANDPRSGYLTALMIIYPDHTEQVPRGISGGSAIYKKSLINGWCINRQRDVLGCVGSQCPGIFIAILKSLPQFKPDPPVTIHSGIVKGAGGIGDLNRFMSRSIAHDREVKFGIRRNNGQCLDMFSSHYLTAKIGPQQDRKDGCRNSLHIFPGLTLKNSLRTYNG